MLKLGLYKYQQNSVIYPINTNLDAVRVNSTTYLDFIIDINADKGNTGYLFDAATDSGFTNYITVSGNPINNIFVTEHYAVNTFGLYSYTYYIRFKPVLGNITGAYSVYKVKTETNPDPNPLICNEATNITSTSVQVNWNWTRYFTNSFNYNIVLSTNSNPLISNCIQQYLIPYFGNGIFYNESDFPWNNESKIFTGLIPNTTYYYRIDSISGGMSNVISFTTLP